MFYLIEQVAEALHPDRWAYGAGFDQFRWIDRRRQLCEYGGNVIQPAALSRISNEFEGGRFGRCHANGTSRGVLLERWRSAKILPDEELHAN